MKLRKIEKKNLKLKKKIEISDKKNFQVLKFRVKIWKFCIKIFYYIFYYKNVIFQKIAKQSFVVSRGI